MFKSLKTVQKGFTIIELLIVIAIIAILATLVLTNFNNAQAKGRDSARVADIDSVTKKLEEYHGEFGGYPETIDGTTFEGFDEAALNDPRGNDALASLPAAADQAAATTAIAGAATDDTDGSSSYAYQPYGCTGGVCTGFILKTFMELEQPDGTQSVVKESLNQ